MLQNDIIMKKTLITLFLALGSILPMSAQHGKIVDDGWLKENYTKREVMVTVRDGRKIYNAIYEPKQEYLLKLGRDASPIMMLRTPYSLKPYGLKPGQDFGPTKSEGFGGNLKGDMANYVAEGYVIVLQNVQGKYLSDGKYENMRPYVSGPRGAADTLKRQDGSVITDESTDTYDTIQWLLKNTKNTGKVGVKGNSYPGFYTVMAVLSRHSAIKAACSQAPATDWFMGDDAHHNGALCLTDCYRFGGGFYREFRKPSTKGFSNLVKIEGDVYDYFLNKPMSEISAFFGDSLRFWSDMMKHPNYDQFWLDRDPSLHLKDIRTPVLVTGGFYDAEDCYGAFRVYNMLKKQSPECDLHLAAGPWYHGGWNNRTANHLADAWFGEGSGAYYQDAVEYPFFLYYLEGKGTCPAKVNVLASGETMSSVSQGVQSDDFFEFYDEWPPKEMKYNKLYLSGKGSLSFTSPKKASRTIVSDPSSPVPYMDIKSDSRDRAYMVADQSFATLRTDVLTYRGEALTKPLHLAGPVKVRIALSLDSEAAKKMLDADIVVKLIDLRPDGYQMLVRGDVMPLRFREGFQMPKPVKAGKKTIVEFTMCDIDHRFMEGHTLMVQVQGSWFPLIAMNPQTFIADPVTAKSEDYQPVTITVKSAESYLELPVCE